MTLTRLLSSAVATIMVMDMLILALALLPVDTAFITGGAPAAVGNAPQEAGFFGCFWSCAKCVVLATRSGGSCVKCARCLGLGIPTKPNPRPL
jgi:hypothetical protein